MRSYVGAFSLVMVMSGVSSAQQEFRSFGPGLSPMMPVAGPEMSKDKETGAQKAVSDRIVQGEGRPIDRLAETARLPLAPSQLAELSSLLFASSQLTEGQLITIHGDSYVLQDILGRRIRVHVDGSTSKDGNITVGDTVLVDINSTKSPAHAESLIKR